MKLMDDGSIYFPASDGSFVSEKQRRVAEILKDYYQYLELQWIPPGERGPQDYAFRVLDRTPGRKPYVVSFAEEADERLLAKVFSADQAKGNALNYIDAHNAAIEALKLKQKMEERQEWHDIAYSVLRSKKIHYKHRGIDFGKPHGGRFG